MGMERIKLRHGRKQPRNIYIQSGPEPSDDDIYIGVIFENEELAQIVVDSVNRTPNWVTKVEP